MKIVPTALILLVTAVLGCQESGKTDQATQKTDDPAVITPDTANAKDTPKKTVLFFGNSLTAGYGLEPSEAFPALIGEKIDSAGWGYQVINSGLSGETSAGGKSRIGWVLRQPVDVFILELGANDGLRGIDLETTRQNLQTIIDTVKAKNPQVTIVLAGMQIPPNMGPAYTAQFRQLYQDLAQKNNTELIPFLLEDVAGIPSLNQDDGIHPTAKGNVIVAENVWKVLEPVLREGEV